VEKSDTKQENRLILAIDDDEGILAAYKGILDPDQSATSDLMAMVGKGVKKEADSFQLTTASQGVDGVQSFQSALENNNPHAVALIDMRMPPGIDGLETARRLRELDERIYLVIVTAYSDKSMEEVRKVLPQNVILVNKPFTKDEIRQTAFNLCRAWDRDRELEHLRESLEDKVEELRLNNQDMKLAKETAEKANRAKSDFLNMISHELRTPLTVVIGNLQELGGEEILKQMYQVILEGESFKQDLVASESALLEQLATDDGAFDQACRLIEATLQVDYSKPLEIAVDALSDAKHLLTLINDVLDLSKIEAGKMEITPEAIEVKQVVEKAIHSIATLAEEKGVSIESDIPPEVVVKAEVVRLKQILLNLLGNAVKFTDRGVVGVVVNTENGFANFQIKDSGCGIPKEKMGQIFEAFTQADSSTQRASNGSGLGLPITQRLVHLHGGKIHVDSVENQGSTFSFTIPLATEIVEESHVQ
jgi:signal transduction histidine kinase